MQADPASHELKLAVAVIFLVGLLAVLGLFSYGLRQLTHVSARVDANQKINTAALCALRADLQQRVRSGNALLKRHPQGLIGIPAPTIRASLNNQQHTINALAPVRCSTPHKPRARPR